MRERGGREAGKHRDAEGFFLFCLVFSKCQLHLKRLREKKPTQFSVKGRGKTVNSFNLPLFAWTAQGFLLRRS